MMPSDTCDIDTHHQAAPAEMRGAVPASNRACSVWIQVCGEVEVSNHAQLQAALSAVDLDGAHAVRLDLRHLTFCDTGGCWRLLRFERDARLSGCRTSIHGARRTVRTVLSLIAGAHQPPFA